jgi:hypothetical protein
MKRRAVVAAGMSVIVGFAEPGAARASEVAAPVPSATWVAESSLQASHARMGALTLEMLRAPPAALPVLGQTPTNIRLSEGAKTAIIVGAIIVGVLIIVGVIALSGKGAKPKLP